MSSTDSSSAENQLSSTPGASGSSPKRIVHQVETTGSYWGDLKEAFKRVSVRDDLAHINEIPCARNSLLSGIASGVGIGVIRGMSASAYLCSFLSFLAAVRLNGRVTGVLVASNWAVGSFMLISLGSWCVTLIALWHTYASAGLRDFWRARRTICQRNREEERRRLQQVIEALPKRYVKPEEGAATSEQKSA
ncbi:hypothetical protein TRAPUB_14087 [Trametes pubescens]|uniref:Cytochrome c oxidase assembly protein COX20, mitochondrial n=1 Tax=Trametes pubescens TaxID=154538 RepID=A0A1M2VP92_TRAPU|nr:hypothetical protein TRAPUB_14087 [Trametes pubescens]